jgi:hypothetical protein
MTKSPKICVFDIENSQSLGYFFDVYETSINHDDIVIPSYIFCISYSWWGEDRVYTLCIQDFPRFKKDIHDDTEVLKEFSKVVEQADILVGHNIDRFDIKKINGRLFLKGLPPMPTVKTIDTLRIAKKYFRLDYNGLDAISKDLGLSGKTENSKGLWRKCFEGDIKSLNQLAKYNKNDVRINKKVFEREMPFLKLVLSKEFVCHNPVCGSREVILKGCRDNKQRFICNKCGSWGCVKI